jgi:hypothetical protein
MHLIPIQYHNRKYPAGIKPSIIEVAGHFNVSSIRYEMQYSLHTEYSFAARRCDSPFLKNLPTIRNSCKDDIPQLWYNEKWASEFADFVTALTAKSTFPKIIEIHPPFNDYCPSLHRFIEIYKVFEDKILSLNPDTHIVIENRFGSHYRGGTFLLSRNRELNELAESIESSSCNLRMILDVPQLFTRHFGPQTITSDNIVSTLAPLQNCRAYIMGLHLWGKKRSDSGRWVAHAGNLNTYFDGDASLKTVFLDELAHLFNDSIKRYFVPEVNSSDSDLKSIIDDLQSVGFHFVEP